jgi:hypothetical protein
MHAALFEVEALSVTADGHALEVGPGDRGIDLAMAERAWPLGRFVTAGRLLPQLTILYWPRPASRNFSPGSAIMRVVREIKRAARTLADSGAADADAAPAARRIP